MEATTPEEGRWEDDACTLCAAPGLSARRLDALAQHSLYSETELVLRRTAPGLTARRLVALAQHTLKLILPDRTGVEEDPTPKQLKSTARCPAIWDARV